MTHVAANDSMSNELCTLSSGCKRNMIICTSRSLGATENWDHGIAPVTMLLDDEPSLLQSFIALDGNDLFEAPLILREFKAMLHGSWWKNTDSTQ